MAPIPARMLFAALVVLVVGCGQRVNLLGIAGNVTFEGKPVPKGTIEFVPVGARSGPSFGSAIINGRYEVLAEHGAREGEEYQVRIIALKKNGKMVRNIMLPDAPAELEDNYIPPQFNRDSILKATITTETARTGIDFALP